MPNAPDNKDEKRTARRRNIALALVLAALALGFYVAMFLVVGSR